MYEKIVFDVENEFLMPVNLKEGHIDISEFYNPLRNQYDANLLLKEIETEYSSGSLRTIGLFKVDLFIPILTFIFGQAYLNGRCGIVSVFRLRNELYGLEHNEKIYRDRVRKEIVHELGHTFGLIHCKDPECVMHSSTYVEDIDLKSHMICKTCKSLVWQSENNKKNRSG